jgi:hypothetical protein
MLRICLLLACLFSTGCSTLLIQPSGSSVSHQYEPNDVTQQIASPDEQKTSDESVTRTVAGRIGDVAESAATSVVTFVYLGVAGLFGFPLL